MSKKTTNSQLSRAGRKLASQSSSKSVKSKAGKVLQTGRGRK